MPEAQVKFAEHIKQDYLRCGGGHCLFCRSKDIRGGNPNADGTWMSNDIECHNCGATWKDIFNLGNVDNVTLPTKEFKTAERIASPAIAVKSGRKWREIDFGDDIPESSKYDRERFDRKLIVMSKVQFETLCGPLNEIPDTKGWHVDHVNPGPTTIETWTVEIVDDVVFQAVLTSKKASVIRTNRCVIVLGEKK